MQSDKNHKDNNLPLIGGGQGRTDEQAYQNAECIFWMFIVAVICGCGIVVAALLELL